MAEASDVPGKNNNRAITQKPLLFNPDNNIFDMEITDSLPITSEPDVEEENPEPDAEEGNLILNDNIFDWFNDSTDAIIWEQPRNIGLKAGVGIILAGLMLSTGVLTWKAWRAWTAKNNYAGGGDDHDIPLFVISHGAYSKLNQTDTSTDVVDENSECGNDVSTPLSAQKPLIQRWKKVPHNKLIYTIGAATSLVATVSSAYYFSRLFTDDNGMMDVFDNIKLDDNDHYTEFFMKSDLNGFQDPQVHFTGRKLQSLNSPELSDSDLMRTPKEILHTLGFNIAETDELYTFYGETAQALLRKTEGENKKVNQLTFLREIDCLLIKAQQDIIENQIKAKNLTNLDALGKINKVRVLIINYLNEHYGDTMEEYEKFLSGTHAYKSVISFWNNEMETVYISKALHKKGDDNNLIFRKLQHFSQASERFWPLFFSKNDGKIGDFISEKDFIALREEYPYTDVRSISIMETDKVDVLNVIKQEIESGNFSDYPDSLKYINHFKNNYISGRVSEIFLDIKNSWSDEYKDNMGIDDTYLDQTSLKNIEQGIQKVVVEYPKGIYKILSLRDLIDIASKITPNEELKIYWPRYLESDQAKLDSINLIHNEAKMLIDLNKNSAMLKSAYETINKYAPQNVYDFANDKIKEFANKHGVDLSKVSTAVFSLTETVMPMNQVAYGSSRTSRPHQMTTRYFHYHYLDVFFNRMRANVIYAYPNPQTNVSDFFLELVNYDLQPAYLSYLESFKADSKLIEAYSTIFNTKLGSFSRSSDFKIQSLTLYYDKLVGIYVATNIKTNEIHILSLMDDKHYKYANQKELQALLDQGSAQVEQGKTSDIEIFNYLQQCRVNMSTINFRPPYSAYRHPSQIKGVDVKLHDLSSDLSQQYYNDVIKCMAKLADVVTVSQSELATINIMETLKILAIPAALLTLPLGALAGITVALLFEAVPALVQGIVTDSEEEKQQYFLEAAISLLAATGGEVAGKVISSFAKSVKASGLFKKATLKVLKPGFFQRTPPADIPLPNSTLVEEPLRRLPVSQPPVDAAITHKSTAITNDWKARVDIEELINDDSKNSYLIVRRLSESLESHPAADAVCKYRMLYLFNSPTDCLPKMHFSMIMTTGGVDYMIDFSTSRLKNLVSGVKIKALPDYVMPENNWAVIVRDAFPNQQLRYKDFDDVNEAYLFATSTLNKNQSFYTNGMIRLNNAGWFLPPTNITRPVIKDNLIPQLRDDPRLHVTDIGEEAVRVSVRGNYTAMPQTALVSSHGLYYHLFNRGTKIPEDLTIEFIAPHEYLLRDPGLDVMNYRCGLRQFGASPETAVYPYSPASRITTTTSLAGIDKFRADKYLRGDSRPDYVRNYVLDPFEGDQYTAAVNSLFSNRRRVEAGLLNADALTDLIVLKKDKSSTTERIMSQLLKTANPPKKIIFSHCRASLNGILKQKIYSVHNYETTGYLRGDKYVTGETRIHTIIVDAAFESTLKRSITDKSVASDLTQLEADTIENRPLMLGPSSDDRWNNRSLWRDGAVLGFITDSKSIASLKLMSSDGEKSLTITKEYNTENVFEVTRINTSLGKKTVSGNCLYSLFSDAMYAFIDDLFNGIKASEFSVTEMVEGTEIVRTGKVRRDKLFEKHPDTANQVLALNPDSGELHPKFETIKSVTAFIENMRTDKSDYSRLTSTTTNVDFFYYLISLHFLPHIPANILFANLADVANDPTNYAILVNEVCSSPRIAYYLDACLAKDGKSLGLTKRDIYTFLNRLMRRALEEISPSLKRQEKNPKNINKFSSEILEKASAKGSPLRLTCALWLAAFYNYRYPGNKATGPGASAEKPGNAVTLSPDSINNIADDNSPQLQH